MKINGKYIIKKSNEKIVQKNNLTIYGAFQLARFLKRDVVFPKINNSPYGYIKSYAGQYKKISIVNGSVITIPQKDDTNNAKDGWLRKFNNNFLTPTISNAYSETYMIDDNYQTYLKMTFNATNPSAKTYFDIDLSQPLKNIAKIGLMAKTQGNQVQEGSDSFYKKVTDWTIYFRPQGVKISIDQNKIGVMVGSSANTSFVMNTAGDYIRVYNINYPLYNGKPYYIMNKIVDNQSNPQRCFYCLFYNGESWSVANVTTLIKTGLSTQQFGVGNKTIDRYIFPEIDNTLIIYSINGINSVNQKTSLLRVDINDSNFTSAQIQLNSTKIDKWIKPVYRLYNYLTNFYGGSENNYNEMAEHRSLQLIADFNQTINAVNVNNSDSEDLKINYQINSNTDFDQYLAYSCYSFQSCYNNDKSGFAEQLYNLKDDEYGTNIDFCNQHVVGFIPYIDGIRFCKNNNDSSSNYNNLNNATVVFYAIDLFVKTPTPYNPIKIALTQDEYFNDDNSWFVDSVQKIGNNKVVFTKTLQSTQGQTIGGGYRKIGLFGNFDGHLNGTLPADISIKDRNCFSQAVFENSWSKDDQQSVVITYELTIGDE